LFSYYSLGHILCVNTYIDQYSQYRTSSSPDPLNLNLPTQPIKHNSVARSSGADRDAQVSGHGVGEGAMDEGSVKRASQISKLGCKVKESLTKSKGKGKAQSDGDSLIERSGGFDG
jgi:hypothetical protein